MRSPQSYDKSEFVKKGPWSTEEDAKLLLYTSTHGTKNWTSVPKKAGLQRCGKSCRLRWTNYLRPNLKHDSFTPQEEELIVTLHSQIGSRWSVIAEKLPGRTDNDVKNYWNTKLRKKLVQRGIDPVTHRPLSDVIRSIDVLRSCSTLTSTTYRVPPDAGIGCCLNRDLVRSTGTITDDHKPAFNSNLSTGEASSSTSTARAEVAMPLVPPSPNFNWSCFLVDDAFVDYHDRVGDDRSFIPEIKSGVGEAAMGVTNRDTVWSGAAEAVHGSGSVGSFIDEILESDRKMMTEFPDFIGAPYYGLL